MIIWIILWIAAFIIGVAVGKFPRQVQTKGEDSELTKRAWDLIDAGLVAYHPFIPLKGNEHYPEAVMIDHIRLSKDSDLHKEIVKIVNSGTVGYARSFKAGQVIELKRLRVNELITKKLEKELENM